MEANAKVCIVVEPATTPLVELPGGSPKESGGQMCGRVFGGAETAEAVYSAIALSDVLCLGGHVMNAWEVCLNSHRECVPVGHAHSKYHDILTRLPSHGTSGSPPPQLGPLADATLAPPVAEPGLLTRFAQTQ